MFYNILSSLTSFWIISQVFVIYSTHSGISSLNFAKKKNWTLKHEKLGIGYIYCASINVNAPSAYFRNISFRGHCQKGHEMALVFITMDESWGGKKKLK